VEALGPREVDQLLVDFIVVHGQVDEIGVPSFCVSCDAVTATADDGEA